jgi:flagellin-like protein
MSGRNSQPRAINRTQRKNRRSMWEGTFDMNLWRRRSLAGASPAPAPGNRQEKAMQPNRTLQKDTAAVSPVIGVILMVAITVVLAAIVFVLVTNLTGHQASSTPHVTFQVQDGNVTVVQNDSNVSWDDLAIEGCDTYPTTGKVLAGQDIADCSGRVVITHTPTNSLLWSGTIP